MFQHSLPTKKTHWNKSDSLIHVLHNSCCFQRKLDSFNLSQITIEMNYLFHELEKKLFLTDQNCCLVNLYPVLFQIISSSMEIGLCSKRISLVFLIYLEHQTFSFLLLTLLNGIETSFSKEWKVDHACL